jgi:NAD(P)-dependent dehydrogenase (short-subunit alcohol dehydrogenase family)
MNKPIVLITGGNSGIGKAASKMLASRGAEVIIACRNPERGKEAVLDIKKASKNNDVKLLVMDLSLKGSILAASEEFRKGHTQLNCIIHNAADFDIGRKTCDDTEDGIERIWATNHLGPVPLTKQLTNEIKQSGQGRVITISSKGLMAHPFLKVKIDDPEFRKGGFSVEKAYYQSKLAQEMYTYWLAQKYRNSSITANCIRVTNVKIDISRFPNISNFAKQMYAMKSKFSITPEQMAKVYVWLALSTEALKYSGELFDEKCRTISSGKYSKMPNNIQNVMQLTEKYIPGLLANK